MKKILLFCLGLSLNAMSQGIDQQQTNANNSTFINPTAGIIGQSFTPGISGYLCAITLKLSSFEGFPPQSFVVDVYGTNESGVPVVSSVLGTSSVVTVTETELTDYTFTFNTPITTTTGSRLAVGVRSVGEEFEGLLIGFDDQNPYGPGKIFGAPLGGGDVFEGDEWDFYFISYVCASPPLPVTLISFTAQSSEGKAEINWQTATESNSSHFNVERSLNGRDFQAIGTVKSAGYSNNDKKYNFIDSELAKLPATVYYRLHSEDLDGSSSYSRIITVKHESLMSGSKLYPNPLTSNRIVQIDVPLSSDQVLVYNQLGRIIKADVSNPAPNKTELNLGAVPAGTYLIKMTGKTGAQTQRVIVK